MRQDDLTVLNPTAGRLLFLGKNWFKESGIFNDLERRNDVDVSYISEKKCHFPLNIIQRIFIGSRVNRFFQMPFKYLWYKYQIPEKTYTHILVIADTFLCGWLPYLKRAKRNGVRIDALLLDSMESNCRGAINTRYILLKKKFKFDHIYTFDKVDAEKYGFIFNDLCYYSRRDLKPVENTRNLTDLYFCGILADGRSDILKSVYDIIIPKNINFLFEIIYGSISGPGIHQINQQSYQYILEKVSDCKCILEIVREHQHGPSLRYFEAVCYNKKLLTNNPYTRDLPYYNPIFMKIFKDPSDVDIDWIRRDDVIDYGYKGDFSPNILIDRILNGVV